MRTECFAGYIYALICDVRITLIFDDGSEGRMENSAKRNRWILCVIHALSLLLDFFSSLIN